MASNEIQSLVGETVAEIWEDGELVTIVFDSGALVRIMAINASGRGNGRIAIEGLDSPQLSTERNR